MDLLLVMPCRFSGYGEATSASVTMTDEIDAHTTMEASEFMRGG
jgi:hypothetical protein